MDSFQDTTATQKIFKLKKRIRAICGGTSASKTISIIVWCIDYAQSHENKKVDIFAESYPHLEDGAIKDFKNIMISQNYWEDASWNGTSKVYTFTTKSVIKFISVDKLGKAKGPRRDVGFINEANHAVTWEVFDQLLVRTKEVMWLDWNPSEEFWYNEHIELKRDHDFLRLTYLDCLEALDPRIIEDIESHKEDKNWWRVYGMGLLGEIETRIYKGWRIIDEIPHEARLERRWLDFGYSNSRTAIGSIYYYNGGWILEEHTYLKGLSNKQVADIFLALPRKEILIIADSADPKSIDEISSYGLNILPCEKGKDSVRHGIQLVQDQPISVVKQSTNIIKEFRNYLWMTNKDGKIINEPIKRNDDHMDGIRYALQTLGRLKQEVSFWDRIYKDELNPQPKELPNLAI